MLIGIDDPLRDDVRMLLAEHLADMRATSPPESVHALDPRALAAPGVTLWSARDDRSGLDSAPSGGRLLGCGALKELDPAHGEIKSMRTAAAARRRGVGASVLARILAEARRRGYSRVSLETGSEHFFAPARAMYAAHGFVECEPFADYAVDPNSVFMTLDLSGIRSTGAGR